MGPQVREFSRDPVSEIKLGRKEKPAWKALVDVIECFLGSHRAENYQNMMSNLLQKYKAMGCRMSLELHFLRSHLDFFPPNLDDVSDEHDERFQQDISLMEMRYQGKFSPSMMGTIAGSYSEKPDHLKNENPNV